MNKPDLIDELMSTKKLNAFFDETERSMTTMIGAQVADKGARRGAWWIYGGAVGLALVGTATWVLLNNHQVVEVARVGQPENVVNSVTPRTSLTSEATPTASVAPLPIKTKTQDVHGPAASQQIQTVNDHHELLGQADATPTIESATRREIDSLSSALSSSTQQLDQARLTYQIGMRQRLLGDVDDAVRTLRSAQTLATTSHAPVLEARSIAELARCEQKRGRLSEARDLFDTAIRVLSNGNDVLLKQWTRERDALAN